MGIRGVVGWSIVVAGCLSARAGGADDPATRRYELSFVMDIQHKAPDAPEPVKLKGDAQFSYGLTPRAGGVTVSIGAFSMVTGEGDAAVRFQLSRAGIEEKSKARSSMTKYDGAPPRMRAMLDTFDAPLAAIDLDEEGAETARKLLSDVKPLADDGMIDNTRIFRVRFPKDADRWDADVTLPMAKGAVVRGPLHFEKRPDARADGPVRVEVSGTIRAEPKVGADVARNGVYKVSGEQFFDPRARDWDRGSWTMDLTFDLEQPGKPPIPFSGVLKLKMKRLPAAEAPPDRKGANPEG